MLVEADQKFFERNYNEFVHLQYLSEIMKLVPELTTPDGAERVDDIIITTDKNGENPITIKYEKDGEEKELHLKPEITDRVNELIRQNIHVLDGTTDKEWQRINFVKNPEHDYFEVECLLKDGNSINTIIPNMTADDLKQVNQIKAYDKKIVIKYLEEDEQGTLVEREKVYNFDLYVTKEELNTELQDIQDTLDNVGTVHQLSDKACSYDCINHGKIGHIIIYNLGETGHMLVSYDVDFKGCLNASLTAGNEWNVSCQGVDLTTGDTFNSEREWVNCTVEFVYDDGTRKLVDAQCNFSHFKFIVPDDAQRGHIKQCRFNGILYFK